MSSNRRFVALDFDGVLCDSAGETAESAWRAGGAFFPDWAECPVPADRVERFRHVRPALEIGFEAIPLMRLVDQGVPTERILANFATLRDEVIAEAGCTPDEMAAQFGEARDRWLREDMEGWLSRHRFYPGTVERVRQQLQSADVFILTTKQERFVSRLLEPVLPEFPEERIYGLDRARPKEVLLAEFATDGRWVPKNMHFVEDRIGTLRRVLAVPELVAVNLYLACWGYALDRDVAEARTNDRIRVCHLHEFLRG